MKSALDGKMKTCLTYNSSVGTKERDKYTYCIFYKRAAALGKEISELLRNWYFYSQNKVTSEIFFHLSLRLRYVLIFCFGDSVPSVNSPIYLTLVTGMYCK